MFPIQTNYSNLSTTLLSSYNTMNTVRLQTALSGASYSGSSILNGLSSLPAGSTQFLSSYQSHMSKMQTAANNVLNPKANADKLAAGSSQSSVAKVSGSMGARGDKYELTVERLASGQVNKSQGVQSGGTLPTIGGALQIRTEKGRFDLNLSAAGAKTNKEALQNHANKINESGAGVTAKVTEKDGEAFLEITSEEDFTLSGSYAQRTGLDQIAQERQDAIYTLQKNDGEVQRFTSKTNSVTLEGTLKATFQGTGSSTISAGTSEAEQLADAMGELVASFNNTLKFLNQYSDNGIGVLNQMKRMVTPPTSEKSMEKIGVTVGKDGSLSFDRDAFVSAFERDSDLVRNVSGNMARGVQSDAKMGMRESSGNLLSNVTGQNAQNMTSYNLLSAYNRNGVYNTMNMYAVGALMNISF